MCYRYHPKVSFLKNNINHTVIKQSKSNIKHLSLLERLHSLVVWKTMVPKRIYTIRWYGLGVGVVLLEKVCQNGGRLWGLIYVKNTTSLIDHFLLPLGSRYRSFSTLYFFYITMFTWIIPYLYDDNGLNFWTVSKPPKLNVFHYELP